MGRSASIHLLFLVVPFLATAQDLKEFEKHVTEFTLANGLHFIVLERHEAPVVSFHTYVNAGSVDDPEGKTGLAHMFEHMAFKGTETIGTKNWPEEKKAMDAIETAYDRLEQERRKGPRADPKVIQSHQAEVKAAIEKASSYVVPNLYPTIIEENGGVGLNASTSLDSTEYFYNLPANRIELWFLLESQRFLHPVFREFYKERDVVMEERRMRVESDPQGKLMETMLASAFEAHPYRRMPGGWASDIQSLRVRDAEQFYKTYYVPANITIGIVGDVDPKQTRALAEKYFRPFARRTSAAAGAHSRAAAGGPASDAGGITGPAIPADRVQAPRSVRSRRSGVRRDQRHSGGRPHRNPLQRNGARQADLAGGGSGGRFSGVEVSEPFHVLRLPCAGPHHTRERENAGRRDRAIQEGKRGRRQPGAGEDKDARRADPAAGQQCGSGAVAHQLLRELWRLAKAVHVDRRRQQGDRRRRAARGAEVFRNQRAHDGV